MYKEQKLTISPFLIQGPEAVRATNVFYYLTYEGAVDLESTQETTTIFHRAKDDFCKS
jgi:hypothetical protein